MNYFKLFNLPELFSINITLLIENFYNLQKKFHPDLFILQSSSIQKKMLKKSIEINNAFQTLKDPYRRAEYLLNLNNIDLNHKNFKLNDHIFLNKYLKLNDEFNQIRLNLVSIQELINFHRTIIVKKIKRYEQKLKIEFENKKWMKANYIIQKIYYLLKLKRNIEKEIEKNNIY